MVDTAVAPVKRAGGRIVVPSGIKRSLNGKGRDSASNSSESNPCHSHKRPTFILSPYFLHAKSTVKWHPPKDKSTRKEDFLRSPSDLRPSRGIVKRKRDEESTDDDLKVAPKRPKFTRRTSPAHQITVPALSESIVAASVHKDVNTLPVPANHDCLAKTDTLIDAKTDAASPNAPSSIHGEASEDESDSDSGPDKEQEVDALESRYDRSGAPSPPSACPHSFQADLKPLVQTPPTPEFSAPTLPHVDYGRDWLSPRIDPTFPLPTHMPSVPAENRTRYTTDSPPRHTGKVSLKFTTFHTG